MYRRSADGAPAFVEAPAPTDEALQAVLQKIIKRTMKLLTRRGVLVEEEGSTTMADNDGDSDEARVLRPLQAAACKYRIAFGPRAGQKVLTMQGAMPRDKERLSWAKLLKGVFELDLEHCPNCGGELKIIAAILEAPVIEKILTHLGLQARAPPRAPVRGQALQAA